MHFQWLQDERAQEDCITVHGCEMNTWRRTLHESVVGLRARRTCTTGDPSSSQPNQSTAPTCQSRRMWGWCLKVSAKQHIGYFLSKLDTSGSPRRRLQTAGYPRRTRYLRCTCARCSPRGRRARCQREQEHVHLLVHPCYDSSTQQAHTHWHGPAARAVHAYHPSSSATDRPASALGRVRNSLPKRREM